MKTKTPNNKTCRNCLKDFSPLNGNAAYCSPRCKVVSFKFKK